jgi:threonyl-tRNA synthetase
LKEEFLNVLDLTKLVLAKAGFAEFTAQISLRDKSKPEKYIGNPENWEIAEQAIIDAATEAGLDAEQVEGEAAFYGPKLDFMIKDAIGRSWQLGTIQVDYNLPDRFELEYIGADNQPHRPVMIHRAPFGSMERFISLLIENTTGKLPLWLAPDQFALLPIGEGHIEYCKGVLSQLEAAGLSGYIDDRNETIGRKIRDTELKKVPYMLLAGDNEMRDTLVALRIQGEGDQGTITVEEFISRLNKEIGSN